MTILWRCSGVCLFGKYVCCTVFETIPQGALQACLAFDVWKLADADISKDDVYLSVVSAIVNSMVQIIKLKLESKACHEKFLTYSLECLMARIGWIPFQKEISKILEKSQNFRLGSLGTQHKPVDYNIKYYLPLGLSQCKCLCPCLYKYQASLDFDFSSLTIKFSLCYIFFNLVTFLIVFVFFFAHVS